MHVAKRSRFYKLLAISLFLGLASSYVSGISLGRKDPALVLKQARDNCDSNSQRTQYILCIKERIMVEVEKKGIRPLMLALEEEYKGDAGSLSGGITRCHDIAHAIGQIGAGENLNESLLGCTQICTSGCYHGVVEGFVAKGGELRSNINGLCKVEDSPLVSTSACFHGLGHGIADINGYDLKKSLLTCDLISQEGARKNCAYGVIMEIYEPSSFAHPLGEFPPDIPRFCQDLWGVYIDACNETAGVHEYGRSKDEDLAIEVCFSVPKSTSGDCISALAQNVYFASEEDIEKTFSFCDKTGPYQKNCIFGALEASIMSDPGLRNAYKICERVEEDLEASCYMALGQKVEKMFGSEKKDQVCEGVPEENESSCKTF